MSNDINISGISIPIDAIIWPSGQFASGVPGAQLCAFLVSLNANFGFNLNPHTFSLEWCPCGPAESFHGASGQLPPIGHPFELFIGEFFLKGQITHTDYTSTTNGTMININVEDDRKLLRKAKIHTEDLGENVPSGVIDRKSVV